MAFAKDLRASVLQAAMQGKLTEQLETDSIAFGNRAMIDDFYFDLPDTWNVVEYGSLCENRMGKTLSQKDVSQGGNIPVYSATQEDKPFGFMKDVELKLHKNDFVIPARGNSIGCVTLVKDDIATCTQTTICSRNIQNVDVEFLYYCTKAFKQQWFKYNGSAIPQITVAQVNANLVPIPPIEEQKRIVRRIEEIMIRIDELEAIEEELKKLKEVFPTDMKAAVLQAAMQGKLTEQLETDGSVDELLDKINAEREQLIKEGKIKKPKAHQNDNFVAFSDDEIPFEIPDNWRWVRFCDIVSYNMGKTPPRAESEWWINDFPWISIADMVENGHIISTKEGVSQKAILEKFPRISPKGTLIMSFKLTVGRVSILDIDAVHNEAIISIYPYADCKNIFRDYLFHILPYVANAGDTKNAIKGKTLNSNSIDNLMIPLPPLEEQNRIVAKLEQILPLIADLS